jgi:hypothetical protein
MLISGFGDGFWGLEGATVVRYQCFLVSKEWYFSRAFLNPNYSTTRFFSTTYNFWTLAAKKWSLVANFTFLSTPTLSAKEICRLF